MRISNIELRNVECRTEKCRISKGSRRDAGGTERGAPMLEAFVLAATGIAVGGVTR